MFEYISETIAARIFIFGKNRLLIEPTNIIRPKFRKSNMAASLADFCASIRLLLGITLDSVSYTHLTLPTKA